MDIELTFKDFLIKFTYDHLGSYYYYMVSLVDMTLGMILGMAKSYNDEIN